MFDRCDVFASSKLILSEHCTFGQASHYNNDPIAASSTP
jgi:hypothetical protein